jgi:hypothetical protein
MRKFGELRCVKNIAWILLGENVVMFNAIMRLAGVADSADGWKKRRIPTDGFWQESSRKMQRPVR